MTTDARAGFLAAILSNPADDLARGAYADALRESDDPFDQLHGRFIWAGLTLAKFRGVEVVEDGMFFDAIGDQNASAPDVLAVQLRHLLGWERLTTEWAWDNDAAAPDRVTARAISPQADVPLTARERRSRRRNPVPMPAVIWERGCVAGVRLTVDRWIELAPKLFERCPVERVEALDVPGLTLSVMGPENGWRLSAKLRLPAVPEHVRFGGSVADGMIPVATVPALPAEEHTSEWRPVVPSILTRAQLVGGVGHATRWVVIALRGIAGERWPGPPLAIPAPDDVPGETEVDRSDRMHRENNPHDVRDEPPPDGDR